MKKSYTVSLREDGKYQVLKDGNQRPTRVFDNEQEALDYVEELKKEDDVTVTVEFKTTEPSTPEPQVDPVAEVPPVEPVPPIKVETPIEEQKEADHDEPEKVEKATEEVLDTATENVGFFKRLWRKLFR